ncbi:MAG TPA: hypothetical protein VGH51_03840 [Candidatus Angelobacter sp.]|jgi:hypothetical protein
MSVIAVIIVLVSVLALALITWMARSSRGASVDIEALRSQLRPMDADAFRNLVDPRERQYLHDRLPPSDFRRIHRERMLAATDYAWCAARNAGILIRLGETARNVSDPSWADAAITLQENAFRLRLQAIQTIPRLYLSIIVPDWDSVPQGLADKCDRLTRQAVILGSMQAPSRG